MSTPILIERTVRLSRPLNRFALSLALLIIFTSSFDIFLVLQAGGNFRFCQIVTMLLAVLAFRRAGAGVIFPVLGARPLLIWLIFQIVFIPATAFWPKSVGYCLWLSLNIILIFSFVTLFSDELRTLATLLRWYVYSFGAIAAFGIVQFTLPVLGYAPPLVAEWWIRDKLPRVNGFSYEPSYFATYLLIGFVLVGSLRRSKSSLLTPKAMFCIYWLVAIAIIVSSSREGIVFLLADMFLKYVRPLFSVIRDFTRLRVVPSKLKALVPLILLCGVVGAVCFAVLRVLQSNPAVILMFLGGTGISNTAAHSVVQRTRSFLDTLTVFVQHPIIGRSLGGVSSAIADLHGYTINSFKESKPFEGMNVFGEALAASGVIGILPFVVFVVTTVRKPLRLTRFTSLHYSDLLRGFVRSLLFAWAALQFNQNVLRPYLWVHIAMLATVYAAALRSCEPTETASNVLACLARNPSST